MVRVPEELSPVVQQAEEVMNALGLEVLRFSNLDIDRNFAGVCEAIDLAVRKRAANPI